MQGKSRYTLIGLLVVLMVYALFILNRSHINVDYISPIAQAEIGMRQIATALEYYYIDNKSYPLSMNDEGKLVPFDWAFSDR